MRASTITCLWGRMVSARELLAEMTEPVSDRMIWMEAKVVATR